MSEQTENDNTAPELSDDEAASLSAIRAGVAAENKEFVQVQEQDTAKVPAEKPKVPLNQRLAGMADMGALMLGKVIPTAPLHFNHAANVEIADALIDLMIYYDYDPEKVLWGEDSALFKWFGLATALAVPAVGLYGDYQAMKPKKEIPPLETSATVAAADTVTAAEVPSGDGNTPFVGMRMTEAVHAN